MARAGAIGRRTARLGLLGAVLAASLGGGAASRASAAAPRAAGGIEVVVSEAGFRPRALQARRGEPLRLLLRSADGEHCFALEAFRIEKRVLPGRATVLEFVPDRAGSFPFYCCLEPDSSALRGTLTVTE